MGSVHGIYPRGTRGCRNALSRSPIWTAYLRLSGARVGERVYIASLSLSDYNLLDLGDDVVIGADVHISGHTVEGGVVKTAGVRLGRNVTIGLGTVIDIGVDVGPDCQVGALSFVPKHTHLEAGAVYAGIPVRITSQGLGLDLPPLASVKVRALGWSSQSLWRPPRAECGSCASASRALGIMPGCASTLGRARASARDTQSPPVGRSRARAAHGRE